MFMFTPLHYMGLTDEKAIKRSEKTFKKMVKNHQLPVFDLNNLKKIPSRETLLNACKELKTVISDLLEKEKDPETLALCGRVCSYSAIVIHALYYTRFCKLPDSIYYSRLEIRIDWYAALTK